MGKSSLVTPLEKRQEPTSPFEVEIETGNRGDGAPHPVKVDHKRSAHVQSFVAVQRRKRLRQRRRLFTIAGLISAIILTTWSFASWWQPILQGSVVARVNGQPITLEQVERQIKVNEVLSVASTGKEEAPSASSMLEQVILVEIQAQAVRQAGFSITAQDVDDGVALIVKRANIAPDKLDASLRSNGLTYDDLKTSLADIALVERFEERYLTGGSNDPKVRAARVNQWQLDLVQKATIERLRNPNNGIAPRVGTQAPDFSLKEVDGKDIQLSALRGKRVVLYVWAPWCPACRAVVPMLEEAYKSQDSNGVASRFEVVAVATQSELPSVSAFIEEFGVTFPVAMDVQDYITDLYQVGPIPTSYFIDKDGLIRAVQVGQMDASTLQQRLDAAR